MAQPSWCRARANRCAFTASSTTPVATSSRSRPITQSAHSTCWGCRWCACARVGTGLIHAKPYDAPARGKMERFWRTLREGCLDFLGSLTSLHDLNVRLWAWLDEHYHRAPHAGLVGAPPASVYENTPRPVDAFDEAMLRKALTIHARRRVRRDSTLP